MSAWGNRWPAGTERMYAQPVIPGEIYDDGWAHERDEAGWCRNCSAPPGCAHARLVPRR